MQTVKLNNGVQMALLFFMGVILSCMKNETAGTGDVRIRSEISDETGEVNSHLTTENFVRDIVNHPAFNGFGELLLPRDNNSGSYNTPLRNIGSLMPYHSHVEPDMDLVLEPERMQKGGWTWLFNSGNDL
jgi:hypothetical protein